MRQIHQVLAFRSQITSTSALRCSLLPRAVTRKRQLTLQLWKPDRCAGLLVISADGHRKPDVRRPHCRSSCHRTLTQPLGRLGHRRLTAYV